MEIIDFSGFRGREEKLRNILRYNMERRKPMFYRTNLLIHSRRVALLLEDISSEILNVYGDDFDFRKALTLALVHDDAEIVTGDIQLYYKDRMSEEELQEVHDNELKAIKLLCSLWPSELNGFKYEGLLKNALEKNCIEAQLVSYCDKIDAICESLHEVHAGNEKFLEPAKAYIGRRIRDFPVKFPILGKILFGKHPLLEFPIDLNFEEILKNGKFHTSDSLKTFSGVSQYERWKEISVEHFGEKVLLEVVEK